MFVKKTALLLASSLAVASLSACSGSKGNGNASPSASDAGASSSVSASGTASASAGEPKAKKTIVFSTITNYYTAGLQLAAEDYQKLHPETTVKIDIVSDNTTYQTSFQAKMAAGGDDAPDIVHANLLGDTPANNVKKGYILKLNDFVKAPNAYNNGTTLYDGINGDYWPYAYTSDGDIFMLPFDLVGTGFYYNKDLFAKAGITEAPTTWEDLFADLQKLKDQKIIPLSMSQATGSDYEGWMVGAFEDWANRSLIPDILVQPGDARNTPEVEAINGKVKYDPANPFFDIGAVVDAERTMALWKSGKYDLLGPAEQKIWSTLKQLSTYLQPGYATMKDADAYQLFISGKAAAYWNGSWQVGQILKDQQALGDKGFEWGTFKFPRLQRSRSELPGRPARYSRAGPPDRRHRQEGRRHGRARRGLPAIPLLARRSAKGVHDDD
ncbi:ABC transporter substrate-binding protein [Cohnella rhizosphaerae]|uniref:Extracellular solute-binding protein n=1 Tax=Cohnella rhizosphaerae TaxID=1457232 RepID=A0A9X4QSL9_9BACL|nr:extracellular solute-binding protein [Cohnella rhizosphaerae]MDG0810221.1 extracellular solute-binding protein [Cohnella rhizosphaerae]